MLPTIRAADIEFHSTLSGISTPPATTSIALPESCGQGCRHWTQSPVAVRVRPLDVVAVRGHVLREDIHPSPVEEEHPVSQALPFRVLHGLQHAGVSHFVEALAGDVAPVPKLPPVVLLEFLGHGQSRHLAKDKLVKLDAITINEWFRKRPVVLHEIPHDSIPMLVHFHAIFVRMAQRLAEQRNRAEMLLPAKLCHTGFEAGFSQFHPFDPLLI